MKPMHPSHWLRNIIIVHVATCDFSYLLTKNQTLGNILYGYLCFIFTYGSEKLNVIQVFEYE